MKSIVKLIRKGYTRTEALYNLALYLSALLEVPFHVAASGRIRDIVELLRAYAIGLARFVLHGTHLGLDLRKVTLVKSYGKYFVVRRYTVDLNVVSPFSERLELQKLRHYMGRQRKWCRIIFIDVGAHIGKYAIVMADLADLVVALEPDPRNYAQLNYNIRLNELDNVKALNMAASSLRGYCKLRVNRFFTAQSHIDHSLDGQSYLLVQTDTLDNIVRDLNLYSDDTCFVLKIDVEGHELEVLQGALRVLQKTHLLLVETELNIYKLKKLLKLLPETLKLLQARVYPKTLNLLFVNTIMF